MPIPYPMAYTNPGGEGGTKWVRMACVPKNGMCFSEGRERCKETHKHTTRKRRKHKTNKQQRERDTRAIDRSTEKQSHIETQSTIVTTSLTIVTTITQVIKSSFFFLLL
jgi:hypothetical protein